MNQLLNTLFISLALIACTKSSNTKEASRIQNSSPSDKPDSVKFIPVYQTEKLTIIKLTDHVYKHISYLNTETFGKVPCNGMLVVNEKKGVVFDTPADNESSEELIRFIRNELKSEIVALIPTHFHLDCVGGIRQFEEYNIPSFVSKKTLNLLNDNNQQFSKPITEFTDSLTLHVGTKSVIARYFGEGHTSDNVIGYFPAEQVIFGGCLVKEVGAGKGNLEDANINEWPETIQKIKDEYPDIKLVIPGHGASGGMELLEYTKKLFEKHSE